MPSADTPHAAAASGAKAAPPPASPNRSARVPIEVAEALTNLGGDRELFLEVLAAFVEELPQQLAELQEASAEADVQRLRALAHGLKGSASNVCAEHTRQLARRIEELSTEDGVGGVAALLAQLKDETDRLRGFAAAFAEGV